MTLVQQALEGARREVHAHPWGRAVWHVWGQGKPPLVLLHGGSGSWTHWVRNVQHLARDHEVWALDMPGFGDSDAVPGVIDADGLVPHLDQILVRALGNAPLQVVGFSFGGMTAGLLAAEQPERIARLVLVGVPGLGLFGKDLPMRGMQADMTPDEMRAVHRYNLSVMMIAHAQCIDEALVDLQEHNVSRDRMRRRRIARTDVLARAQSRWQCEVRGIWGGRDALYAQTLSRVPEVLHRMTQFHCIPDAGHWVQFEAPDAFHRALAQCLSAQ